MFDLKCKRQNCAYNKSFNCTAASVDVSADTACKTYKSIAGKREKTDKLEQKPVRKNTSVTCDANCVFNDQCNCKANGISVMTNDCQPECSTFMPK